MEAVIAEAARRGQVDLSLVSFVLTPGRAADSPQFIPVLRGIRVRGPTRSPWRGIATRCDKTSESHPRSTPPPRRHHPAPQPPLLTEGDHP
jgi:hypothetical protein